MVRFRLSEGGERTENESTSAGSANKDDLCGSPSKLLRWASHSGGKKIFPSRHSCYAHFDCWTVYLPDLILLSDFYVDNLKKSDSSCFCHVNRIRIGILTWGCAERIYTRDLQETHSPTKFSLFPESVLLFRYTVANARRDVTSGNHRKWPERENWEKVSKKQAITKTQVNVL